MSEWVIIILYIIPIYRRNLQGNIDGQDILMLQVFYWEKLFRSIKLISELETSMQISNNETMSPFFEEGRWKKLFCSLKNWVQALGRK